MASLGTHVFTSSPAFSRRATPRLDASRDLHAFVVALNNLAVEIRDFSFGGFATLAARPFTLGLTYQFRFVTKAGVSVVLRARVAHCERSDEPSSPAMFVTGWEFIRRTSENTEGRIGQLIDAINLSSRNRREDW